MSNPAPTLNQINAFNATQGTTIDFNIIGGTEVIRSNKIYIYDLSDNSLICTHLYVSTESIHELPPNTSSSIVYASGKSSADFTNNTQYYAQIQTFTDIAGTEGGSGLSVAKMFWCLVDPTLTIDAIPLTISTTSYNVSATYDTNTSVVSNIIQQYQFNLYNATGSLLQSSGVIVGNGEQQGTSTAYDISYNFTGLSVGSSYYVVVDVTTTQGMSVNAQSSTFTVSIDTPTLGEATVVNNACDGYISVTSNLSSEYGGSGSGDIVSFETDSENVFTKLQVDLEPVQDGTPWQGTDIDREPYQFRAMPQQSNDYNREYDTIVGGTVAWNQLFDFDSDAWTIAIGLTLTATNGRIILSGTANASNTSSIVPSRIYNKTKPQKGHKYLLHVVGTTNFNLALGIYGTPVSSVNLGTLNGDGSKVFECTSDAVIDAELIGSFTNGISYSADFYSHLIDLTAMFGTTIADYIYSLEQATAGAGVAWFKKLFPKPYYEYNAGELLSVEGLESHDTVGFNQWDEVMEDGTLNWDTGANVSTSSALRSKNYIQCVSDINYYFKFPNLPSSEFRVCFYDANKNYAGRAPWQKYPFIYKTPANCAYMRFVILKEHYGSTYQNNICINLSWDGERDGEYEEYVKHSYPLDNSLTLRGIPKLDSSNNLYYDGDTYESDGTVTRKYGIVDLGTLKWNYNSTYSCWVTSAIANAVKKYPTQAEMINAIAEKYVVDPVGILNGNNFTVGKFIFGTSGNLFVKNGSDSATPTGGFVYELATPTIETADPYTNPQIVDPSGTEEYVGSPIPVGHKTTYQRICPITGWTGCEVDVAGVNLNKDNSFRVSTNAYGEMTFATSMFLKAGKYKASISNWENMTSWRFYFRVFDLNGNVIYYPIANNAISFTPQLSDTYASGTACVETANHANTSFTFELFRDAYVTGAIGAGDVSATTTLDYQLEIGTTATPYKQYNGTTYNITWQTEAGTVYGGTVDVVTGVLTVTWGGHICDGTDGWINDVSSGTCADGQCYIAYFPKTSDKNMKNTGTTPSIASNFEYNEVPNISLHKGQFNTAGSYYRFVISDPSITTLAQFNTWLASNPIQLVYELATPIEISLTPQQMQTLSGQNNIWSNTNGGMYLVYQLPITSLLVKRRDVADISGKWLTLYSTPITQASDMDFTFIDFLNQYGKTYQYALVPVLEQDQSGVIVQIEGGYTVSDNVDSIFDGVYIADQTNVERVKAGAGYGNIDMNQGVGSITPIGSKYPIVITNSQNQYHNGSIRGTIVPNDFYSNGNLSRIDMVNKRDELEQFLTNKRAKIIKDWNGNIWLVMIMSNVNCSFDDNYGMGMVSFSADWLEVGDPTNQQDLYNAGLINVGGV